MYLNYTLYIAYVIFRKLNSIYHNGDILEFQGFVGNPENVWYNNAIFIIRRNNGKESN